MPHIGVRFIGLCTHVTVTPFIVPHRAVLLSHEGGDIDGHHVNAHSPKLYVSGTADVVLELRGRVWVENAVTGAVVYDDPIYHAALPRLSKTGDEFTLDADVVENGKKPAAAYFDITSGFVSVCNATADGAIAVTARIDTTHEPRLKTKLFDDGPESHLDFPSGTVLNIVNTADGHDGDEDYLINFLICRPPFPRFDVRQIPQAFQLPSCFAACGPPPIDLDFSPKCSNTGYP